ncbi:lysophospholipid acyltransferase family protein [uncultured Flavobacterium sp.]|uniref:lysophospholipid acyltransferase family protein n=1 Tax=uncultured Flavobacterium sp. TaxID=165435 RepID=UPI0030CA5AE1
MQLILFLILFPILFLISILPFRALYILSDIVYLFVYHVFGYRKKVVRENLAITLPHLSDEERLVIEKKSYRHLCDLFLEMIKTMSISRKEMDKRFVYKNWEEYELIENEGKSIALLCAHYASYEWAVSLNSKISFKGFAIYKKINNKYFDKLVRNIRSKFHAELIPINKTAEVIEYNYLNNIKALYGFASDQSPQLRANNYWHKFMGIEVPVYVGTEMLSKKFDLNILLIKIKKVKRGFYEAEFETLSTNVKEIPDFELMNVFLEKVEQQILEAPEFYLWTHKRWKHRGKRPI